MEAGSRLVHERRGEKAQGPREQGCVLPPTLGEPRCSDSSSVTDLIEPRFPLYEVGIARPTHRATVGMREKMRQRPRSTGMRGNDAPGGGAETGRRR